MAAIEEDFEVAQGETFEHSFQYVNKATGVPVPLAGYTAKMEISSQQIISGDGIYFYTMSSTGLAPQITLNVPSDGFINLEIPYDVTKNFNFDKAYYDLFLISPAGKSVKILKGAFTIERAVTRLP